MRAKVMLSSAVVGAPPFRALSYEAQALYVILCLEADPYGLLIDVGKHVRGYEYSQGALNELVEAKFLLPVEANEYPAHVVRHWWENNDFKGEKTGRSRYMADLIEQVCTKDSRREYHLISELPEGYTLESPAKVRAIRNAVKSREEDQSLTSKEEVTNPLAPNSNSNSNSNKIQGAHQQEGEGERGEGETQKGMDLCLQCHSLATLSKLQGNWVTVQCEQCGMFEFDVVNGDRRPSRIAPPPGPRQ